MKKHLLRIVAVFVVAVMVIAAPLQVFAAGRNTYISDIMVVTASTLSAAKAKLKKNGYTPMSADVNENNGKAVCIGYKTTNNPDEAITDIAVMNMNGGYSLEDYEQVLLEYQETADKLVAELSTAVSEYRANYKAGKTRALIAHELLNLYYDKDFGDTDNKLGDILAAETTTDEQLSVIFMEASSLAVTSIESLLGLACSDNWVDRLLAMQDESIIYTTEDDDNARTIYKSMPAFQKAMLEYEEIYNASGLNRESSEEEWTKYSETLTEEQQNIVANYGSICQYLKDLEYKDGSLYDFFMQDLKEIDNADLYPLAHAMTAGQLATVQYASLASSLQYALTSEDVINDWLENLKENPSEITVDVFDGVDRSIFTSDGIALTSEALRQSTSTSDYSWYKGGLSADAEKTYWAIIGTTAGIAAVGAAIAYYAWLKVDMITTMAYQTTFNTFTLESGGLLVTSADASCKLGSVALNTGESSIAQAGADAIAEGASSIWSSVLAVSKIISGIAIAVCLITIIIFLQEELRAQHKAVEYTEIPRIMVDKTRADDGTHKYVYYYAAKDETGACADLNAWSGTEWNALYYTKDSTAGNPILADAIFQSSNKVKDSNYNLALHGFGSTAAYNLNKYAQNQSGIFAFFKTIDRATLAGTAVSYGSYGIVGVCGAAVGAAIMYFIDKTIARKPRKKEQEARA